MERKIKIHETVFNELRQLEESLWRAKTRYDLTHQEKVFAADFFEFGRSGRTYSRDQLVRPNGDEICAKIPLEKFKVHAIDEQTVLVTYVSEVQYENLERANRSSIWTKTSDGWKIRFHQGTPTT